MLCTNCAPRKRRRCSVLYPLRKFNREDGIKAGPGLFRHWHFPTAISSTGHSGNKARSEVHFSPSGACTEACVVIRDLTYMRNWAEDREYSEQYGGRAGSKRECCQKLTLKITLQRAKAPPSSAIC